MAKARKASAGSSSHSKGSGHGQSKSQKKKPLGQAPPPQRGGVELVDPRVQAQLKTYDEALALFHQQKFARAKQELEEVLKGPSKELADRARMHLKIAEQRMKPSQEKNPHTAGTTRARAWTKRAKPRPRPTTFITRWRRLIA
jgi:TolA-binding protein